MNKNKLVVLIALIVVSLFAQDTITQYNPQPQVTLEANILKLGYSPDQNTLVELIIGVDQFYVYRGIRGNDKQLVNIIDGGNPISPATFAFSQDNTLLVVGSKTGSVYGFDIINGILNTTYSYKYILPDGNQPQINSISISPQNKIALGAGINVYILTVPTDGTDLFVPVSEKLAGITVSAVAWKNTDQNSVLVGCTGVTGLFTIYDIAAGSLTDISTDTTFSIAVVKDGRVFQGRVTADIQIWNWDGTNQKYISLGTIANTVYATEITFDSESLYFAAEINAANVLAWKIDALTEKNLQISQLPTLPTLFLNTTGTKFALSGNGNQILVVPDATGVVNRFNLCNDGNYYNNNQCLPCGNGCKNCFDATTCLSCPQYYFITDINTCTSCGGVTPGCLDCSNSATCTACDPSLNRDEAVSGGVCVCNTISYPNGNLCTLCKDSIDFCKSCDDAQHCTACYGDGNINPEPQNFTCDCNPTWYLENKTCMACSIITGCINCDDAKTCTLCDDTNSFERDGNGGCQCITGKWYNQDTLTCQLCSTKVTGCSQCQQDGTCTVCQGVNRIPNPENTQCVCRSHTFEDPTNVCQLCDLYEQCLQCTEANNCTVCDKTQNRDQQPVNGTCLCKAGFIESNTTHLCLACTVPGCSQCAQDQVCSKCFTSLHFQELAVNGSCVCQSNYHPVDDNSKCLTCDEALTGCINCDTLKECKQCDDEGNFELNADTKTCQCKSSFYQLYKECYLCSDKFPYCQNCNKDQCQECRQGFTYNEQKNTCDCSSDRNFDEQAGTCEEKAGLSALAIIAIIVGILALAGAAVAAIKYFKKRQSPLEDGQYESLEGKDK